MIRIGQGYDLHRLEQGENLILGGVTLESDMGTVAHSDGDALIHALIDALLGAVALGDIGSHFPPSDNHYKNADSRKLLRETRDLVCGKGYRIINIDTTIILEAPKLRPHIDQMRAFLAEDLNLPVETVSVKAKTNEKVDAVGEGRAVEALAAVLLEKADHDIWV